MGAIVISHHSAGFIAPTKAEIQKRAAVQLLLGLVILAASKQKPIIRSLIPVPMSGIAVVSRPRNDDNVRQRNGGKPRRNVKVPHLAWCEYGVCSH